MSGFLLHTKLMMPVVRPTLVARPHLRQKLDDGLGHPGHFARKLTLITAPAGFGKTTLIAAWQQALAQSPRLAAGWLSLDESDNDISRFLTYLVAALQTAVPAVGETALAALQTNETPVVEVVLGQLINDLARLDTAVLLVLDDYHVIENTAVHQALTFWLDYLPPTLHLVITSRADPPLPLPRWQARQQVLQLRASDLRFNQVETAQFLNDLMALDLPAAEVETVTARTEGWVAGLQLAALALQSHIAQAGAGERTAFIDAFAGDDRYIVDYLLAEVLNRQPDTIRRFLLYTAVLDRMCASLCDAVCHIDAWAQEMPSLTGLPAPLASQPLLEYCERANLFIMPLDNKREWYRYHTLFADLLCSRLQQTEPEMVARLHGRAADWYAEAGLVDDAIRHALAAGAIDRAADLVEQHLYDTMWVQSDMHQAWRWLNDLPQAVIARRPQLAISRAWARFTLFADDWAAISADMVMAQTAVTHNPLPAEERARILAQAEVIEANRARYEGDPERAIELAQRALSHLPEDDLHFYGGITIALASSYEMAGWMAEALVTYQRGLKRAQVRGASYTIIFATARMIEVLAVQGQLHQAAALYARLTQSVPVQHGPEMGMAMVAAGNIYREWNDLAQAEKLLQDGIALCRPFDAWQLLVVVGSIRLAWVKLAQGEIAAAGQHLQTAVAVDMRSQVPYPAARQQAAQAWFWLKLGNETAVAAWQDGLSAEDSPTYLQEFDYLVLARSLIVQRRWQEVDPLLIRLADGMEAGQRHGRLLTVRLLQALADHGQGRISSALATLADVLTWAQAQGYVRLFVDEGDPMRALLDTAVTHLPTHTTTIRQLLDAFPDQAAAHHLPLLTDPLTEKEQATLRLLATDLTTTEIADQLYVAVSTVRSHTKSLYSKLDVHSRHEAVTRGRELGLI